MTVRRLAATLAAASAALAATGCGGQSGQAEPIAGAESRQPTTVPRLAAPSAATPKTNAPRSRAASRPRAPKRQASKSRTAIEAQQRRALAAMRRARRDVARRTKAVERTLSAKQRREMAARLTESALHQFGVEDADVAVDPTGRRVVVTVPETTVCGVDAPALRTAVRLGASYVESIVVHGGSPCRLPRGTGTVIFEHAGRGVYTSQDLDVPSGGWRLEYASGGSLAILVFRGMQSAGPPITIRRPGTGARTLDVAGPVKLQVVGSAAWKLRVRALG